MKDNCDDIKLDLIIIKAKTHHIISSFLKKKFKIHKSDHLLITHKIKNINIISYILELEINV